MFLTTFTHTYDPLNRVFLHFGPIHIMWYAVCILTGAMIAMVLGIIEGKKIGIDSDFVIDLALYGIPISVVGARIYYVIFELPTYLANPISVFEIWQGGLAIHGALIAAVIWGLYLCKKRGVNFLKTVDLGAPGFLIAQAMGRWGNFMNQEAHGGVILNQPGNWDAQRQVLVDQHIPTFIINQMFINDPKTGLNYYYPTFFYESLWNLVGLAIVLILRRTKWLYIGDLGLFYLMWYSVGRYFVEGMRTDSLYIGNTGYRTAQVISVLLFIGGLSVFILRRIYHWAPKKYFEVLEENKTVKHA